MRYGSVCSGIEAATVAWKPMGWKAAWFSEIAPFPSRVLAHHYPEVPNHGSLIGLAGRLTGGDRNIDLLVGGTPCQAFSLAGLQGGMADERGQLSLEFMRLADALRPRWVVWENVAGVMSSGGGRDFGSILGALASIGYGFAWRVLDSQFFGVPQRRRRVYVVAHRGGEARRAAAVLLEPASLRGHSPARGEVRDEDQPRVQIGAGGRGPTDRIAQTLNHRDWKGAGSYMNGSIQSVQMVDGELRRLTVLERERLMGFPDGYTNIPGAGEKERIEVTGNSMVVKVMAWIGQRIEMVDNLKGTGT